MPKMLALFEHEQVPHQSTELWEVVQEVDPSELLGLRPYAINNPKRPDDILFVHYQAFTPDALLLHAEQALADGTIPDRVRPRDLTAMVFPFPDGRQDMAAVAKQLRAKWGNVLSWVWACYLTPRWALNVTDFAPMIAAGLFPPHADDQVIESNEQKQAFVVYKAARNGRRKLIKTVSIDDILNADLGGLLSPTMTGFDLDVVAEPRADFCLRVSSLWRSQRAFLVSFAQSQEKGAEDRATRRHLLRYAADVLMEAERLFKKKKRKSLPQMIAEIDESIGMGGGDCLDRFPEGSL